jgi:hypothetical protein
VYVQTPVTTFFSATPIHDTVLEYLLPLMYFLPEETLIAVMGGDDMFFNKYGLGKLRPVTRKFPYKTSFALFS